MSLELYRAKRAYLADLKAKALGYLEWVPWTHTQAAPDGDCITFTRTYRHLLSGQSCSRLLGRGISLTVCRVGVVDDGRFRVDDDSATSRLAGLIDRIGDAVALEADSEDERLRKAVMTFSVYLISFGGGLFWGVVYGALGLWWSAVIPFAYTGLSLLNIALLYRTKRDRFFLLSQLVLILVLPFLLQWSAGGFVASGGVMLWAILAPVGALMFHGVRESTRWLVAYLALVAVSGLIDVPLRSTASAIGPEAIAAFFASNVILVSSILFLVLRHFVAETEQAKHKSDALLLHMLPESIAHRLKVGEAPIADRIDLVSIVFADIVDFTPLSEELEPEDLIVLLNGIYAAFDAIADSLEMEKIRTAVSEIDSMTDKQR